MLRKTKELLGQKGGIMVEAIAMLGLISMVTPVLYKKAAERTTELQDINTATHMRTLSKALDGYIQDHYAEIADGGSSSVDVSNIEPYLPLGFNAEQMKTFSNFQFSYTVEGVSPNATITGFVAATPYDGSLNTIRKNKIASMIGANGGIVNGSDIMGVQGGWSATTGDFNASDGDIVAISSSAITASSGNVSQEDVLYRVLKDNDTRYNTMQTALYMNDNAAQVNKLVTSMDGLGDSNLTIAGSADGNTAMELIVKGTAAITSNISGGGGINVSNGDVELTATSNAFMGMDSNKGVFVNNENAKLAFSENSYLSVNESNLTGRASSSVNIKAGNNATLELDDSGMAKLHTSGASVSLSNGAADITASNATITANNNINISASGGSSSISMDNDINVTGNTYFSNNLTASDSLFSYSNAQSLTGTISSMAPGNKYHVKAENGFLTDNIYISENAYIAGTLNTSNLNVSNIFQAGFNDTGKWSLRATPNRVSMRGPVYFLPDNVTDTATSSFYINAQNKDVVFEGNNIGFRLKGDSNTLTMGDEYASIEFVPNGSSHDIEIQKNNIGLFLDGNKIEHRVDNDSRLYQGSSRLVFGRDEDSSLSMLTNSAYDLESSDSNANTSQGILMHRKGIIQLPTNSNSTSPTGYIKADRMVANTRNGSGAMNTDLSRFNPYQAHFKGVGGASSAPSYTLYDQYQINPAYTSVMHDIKLTTRGGARLSDILPDFINKGIYVLDNTYKEAAVRDWTTEIKISSDGKVVGGDPENCGSETANCAASPWMGFIPSPQCPPGYAKVVTIHPIRWKMADVYHINKASGDTYSNLTNTYAALKNPETIGEKFRIYFNTPTNPEESVFHIFETNVAATNTSHTHTIVGNPLTFQANTWLNTTVTGIRSGNYASNLTDDQYSDAFLGWNAVMGFLYNGSDYSDYLEGVGTASAASSAQGKIVWNLFPVFNQEMAAIADTYCYFERSNGYVEWNGSGGNNNEIDTQYDQLENFRSGFGGKPTGYVDRLNDPTLKYTDPW